MIAGGFEKGSSNTSSADAPPTGGSRRAEIALKPIPISVPRARRFILALEWVAGANHERLAVVTAEVVTNAILHARTPLLLRATERRGGIRVSVSDGSTNPPVMKDYGPTSPTGRGLHIVEALADRWGVDRAQTGKTVWFELDIEDEPT